jgi:ABC-2 type transport system ATP-binding protein
MEGLVCKSIYKTYDGRVRALGNISFSLPDKGIFAMIGRNGAGKTTLVRILSTELIPTKGSATIKGLDVVKDPSAVREIVAIVPQEARAIPWLTPKQTIISYLLYRGMGYSEASKRAEESLKKLGIQKSSNKLNRLLSGGTKRKVLVATVLASEAKVIFLDEPTTGLDPISRNDLWKLLKDLKDDYLIFLTTHYLEEAEKLADKIGVIEKGRLIAMGTMEELRSKVEHQYSIRILGDSNPIKTRKGVTVKGIDGTYQILTSESDAFEIARELIKKKIKFSTNPVSLEDIFYYLVRKPIDEDSGVEEGGWR